jgi:deoxyribonuclease V
MRINPLHRWDVSPAEARALQAELAARVDVSTPLGPWRRLAAADVSYTRGDTRLYAAVVVFDREEGWREVERVGVEAPLRFPYVPGLLSFREAPAVLEAFGRLEAEPDVVMCDGQGIAHPRRLGLATHLGLWLGRPTIGCAKSRLVGTHEPPGPLRGDRSVLWHGGEAVGVVLRTRDRVSPLFVSPGHLCDVEGAVAVVLETGQGRRLPEPALRAHEAVNAVRRAAR